MSTADISRASRERGAIVFFVLLAMSVVAFLIRKVTTQSTTYSDLTHTYRKGLAIQNSLREQVVPPSSSTRECVNQSILIDSESRTIVVCSLGLREFTTSPTTLLPTGRIDYNALFAHAAQCPGVRRNTSSTSFDTPHAATDCALPATLKGGGSYTDNLEAPDLSIEGIDETKTSLLATPGYITISGTLFIKASLLIIAGGDVSIENLSSQGKELARVTIVSAHGSTVVQRVTGNLSLLVLGRTLISVPLTPFIPPFPLPPFRAAPSVSGIIRPLSG